MRAQVVKRTGCWRVFLGEDEGSRSEIALNLLLSKRSGEPAYLLSPVQQQAPRVFTRTELSFAEVDRNLCLLNPDFLLPASAERY